MEIIIGFIQIGKKLKEEYRKEDKVANWKYRLELSDLWKAKKEGKLTIEELAKQVAQRIRRLPCYEKYEEELLDIVLGFEHCVNNLDDFDNVLEQLYDWADIPLLTRRGEMQRKMCWVDTF